MSHFGNRSLDDSQINRNGLPAGTPAPAFRLPTPMGEELALDDYRGRHVLLVFSDPACEPCNQLAPALEELHRSSRSVQILMISRRDSETNCAKIAEFGLTFPIALQRQWEISRVYGMFATPIAYLVNERGVTVTDVAVGVEAILFLARKHDAASELPDEEAFVRAKLENRLDGLRKELMKGERQFREVEREQTLLRETILRISGAIHILEEVLREDQPNSSSQTASDDSRGLKKGEQ